VVHTVVVQKLTEFDYDIKLVINIFKQCLRIAVPRKIFPGSIFQQNQLDIYSYIEIKLIISLQSVRRYSSSQSKTFYQSVPVVLDEPDGFVGTREF
jgi:hypothetical protein